MATYLSSNAFQNTLNGYRETVTPLVTLWAFLFGPMYFAWRNNLGMACINSLFVGYSIMIGGAAGVVVWLFVAIVFAFSAKPLLEREYRRAGWTDIDEDFFR